MPVARTLAGDRVLPGLARQRTLKIHEPDIIPAGGTVERSVPFKAGDSRYSSKGETAAGGKGHEWKSYSHLPEGKTTIWKLLKGQQHVVDVQP